MNYRFTTKKGIFEINEYYKIPLDELHSINDEPAIENLITGWKEWNFEGKTHRESGPARIWSDEYYEFYLNDESYKNVNSWLEDHPNQSIEFQVMMRLKYS